MGNKKDAVTVRTSEGLRDMLFDEIDMLRNGHSTTQRASAVAKMAVQVINSVRIEIDYQLHLTQLQSTAKNTDVIAAVPKLRLGNE
ncbi:MAG: hypothetical protein R8K20_11265 [Gallionellaceae bacterium]